MPKTSPYTKKERARWRKMILDRGRGVSKKLEDLLAGKDVLLESIIDHDNPGETKEERLRRYLNFLMETKRRLDEDVRYGICEVCEQYISAYELNEAPWVDCCHTCAGKAR